MTLPVKPDDVADASDALWEAALDAAYAKLDDSIVMDWRGWSIHHSFRLILIEHARLLILQGEVIEPVDPLDAAIEAAWDAWQGADRRESARVNFIAAIRKHLAPFLKEAGQ
jgi:hypothetical protein